LVSSAQILGHRFEGKELVETKPKSNLVGTALHYLNSPYMWGGKSPFGIDCSGLVQCVYQLHGIQLPRDAYLQAAHGETLGFIDESEPGDLAFFDDHEGKITHVGIIMPDYHIIHAFGQVRIDRLDQTGIFNNSLNTHTHKLRVIKKIM
jgi:cell wall-associated NlpC family hydrolase